MARSLVLLGVAALLAGSTTAIDFKKYKNCQDCLDAGYGWCPIRRMCGGFANKNCRGDHTDKVKTPEEIAQAQAKEEEQRRRAAEAEANSDVVALTDATFASEVSSMKVALVEFYAPWCGHCKALAPAYEEAATTLKNEGSVARLVKVDATANRQLASKYGVSGFPTIKLFREGEFEADYDSGREAHDIAEYMRAAAEEASKPRPKEKRVINFSMAVASKLLKHRVNRQLMIFGSTETLQNLRSEIDAAGEQLETSGPNMLILLLDTTDSSLRAVLDRFLVPMHSDGPIYRVADSSGVGGLAALRPAASDKAPAHPATAAGFVAHAADFDAGKFRRVLRSASQVPAPLVGDAAEEIIGDTFLSKVIEDKKDHSVVFFYMPGCGHCKNLKPHFRNVATYLPIDNDVKFFTIDGTRNEVESSPVAGYPTVYFYPKGNKKNPVTIGARDEKGLREFIAARASSDAGTSHQEL